MHFCKIDFLRLFSKKMMEIWMDKISLKEREIIILSSTFIFLEVWQGITLNKAPIFWEVVVCGNVCGLQKMTLGNHDLLLCREKLLSSVSILIYETWRLSPNFHT